MPHVRRLSVHEYEYACGFARSIYRNILTLFPDALTLWHNNIHCLINFHTIRFYFHVINGNNSLSAIWIKNRGIRCICLQKYGLVMYVTYVHTYEI